MSAKDCQFSGRFKRVSPAQFAEKIGLPLGWIVVNYGHIPKKASRRKAHGAWFEVKSNRGKAYRMLRFSPRLKKGNYKVDAEIVID